MYEVARNYALCATAVAVGKKPADLTPQDQKLREEYLQQSLEALTQAIGRGYRNRVELEFESDLAPLRLLPCYQALLAQIQNRP